MACKQIIRTLLMPPFMTHGGRLFRATPKTQHQVRVDMLEQQRESIRGSRSIARDPYLYTRAQTHICAWFQVQSVSVGQQSPLDILSGWVAIIPSRDSILKYNMPLLHPTSSPPS